MKLNLPGQPLNIGLRQEGVGEFRELLGAEVVAQTEVRGAQRNVSGGFVQTELVTTAEGVADILELSWEGGIVELVPAARVAELYPDQVRGGSVTLPLRRRVDPVVNLRGAEEFALEGVKHLRLAPAQLAKSGVFQLVRAIEDRFIGQHGLLALGSDATLMGPPEASALSGDAPTLVLLHGAFSNTTSSFEGLFASREWQGLFDQYRGRVCALEQRTLTDSPAAGALDLIRGLPRGARLHLLSYSRGGLVGELLCRAPWSRDDRALGTFFSDPKYGKQRAELEELSALREEKGIQIERFARVGCPAAGTLLASRRLDRYLDVLLSLLGKVSGLGSPAFSFAKAIALAIVGARARADLFPGLEAMMPQLGQGFMPFLNASEPQSGRELAVVAGDVQGGGLFDRMKAFFADLYYWEDNDFVVDSKSMFRGVPREGGLAFYHRAPSAHHYSYFSAPETRRCIVDWLVRGESERLRPMQSTEAYGGLRSLELRDIPKRPGAAKRDDRPVVFLLPGIMGTHLMIEQERIWVSILKLVWGGLGQLGTDAGNISCDGLVERYYEKLYDHLSQRHRVEPFAFDWRLPIAEAAKELAQHVQQELDAHDRPVRFIAHSMGGLVCRALIARHRPVWDQLVKRGGRLVMLGTPNHGSYVPAQVFTQQHSLMAWLARLDTKNTLDALTQIVCTFPGLLEMLPWSPSANWLSPEAWASLARFMPDPRRLAGALAFRRLLAEQGTDPKHMVYVAGRADATPHRLTLSNGKVEFGYTRRGDGTVPWELGLLDGVDTYYVDAQHGQIPNHERSFDGFEELLTSGRTSKLSSSAAWLERSAAVAERDIGADSEPDPRYYPQAEDLLAHIFGRPAREPSQADRPLLLSVTHGDIREARAAVLVGHYRGDKLVSVERSLDRMAKGALSVRHRLGVYPGEIGSVHIDPPAIVVGLGQVGELTRDGLEQTVERGLIEYALAAARAQPGQDAVEVPVSSVLIGTYGGTRLTVEASIEAIARGALRANGILRAADGDRGIRISELEFVELYEDIATEAAHAARGVAAQSRGALSAGTRLRQVAGALRSRPRSPYASGWSQRITVRAENDSISYHVATDLARAEPFERPVEWRHVEPLLVNSARTDAEARAVLFRYLLPHELVSGSRTTDVILDLDERAAAIPWELLGPVEMGLEPLGVRFGLLRQLSTTERRAQPVRSKLRRALVIGNPSKVNPSLPGARDEAKAVVSLFQAHDIDVIAHIETSADEIFRALWCKEYDFIHIAAHGEYDKLVRKFGVVMEDGRRLTSGDFDTPSVPTMVFLNCCHLGAFERDSAPKQPGQLAASIAQHLIQMGVKVVVAAGWAVNDRAAVVFATSLYDELLSGRTLMDAVRSARRRTYAECSAQDVTWGAYQVYGHDGFVLPGVPEPAANYQRAASFVAPQEFIDFISDYGSRSRSGSSEQLQQELTDLLQLLPTDLHDHGDIAFAVGIAYGELGAYPEAIRWLTRAIQDSKAPFKAIEQLANFEGRLALKLPPAEAAELFDTSTRRLEALIAMAPNLERHALLGATHKRRASAQTDPENKRIYLGRALEQYVKARQAEPNAPNLWYPALNAALLSIATGSTPPTDAELMTIAKSAAAFSPANTWSRATAADVALIRFAIAHLESPEGACHPEPVARLYLAAFTEGAGSTQRERDSIHDHLSSIIELVLSEELRKLLQLVREALADCSEPPISGVVMPSNPPRAAE